MAFWPKRRGDVADMGPSTPAQSATVHEQIAGRLDPAGQNSGPLTSVESSTEMLPVRGPALLPVRAPAAGTAPMPDDKLARDLMIRVGRAIDEWAAGNDLGAIPHRILFEQALSILNAFDRTAARPRTGRV
jgi:hypothetical protein